MAKWKGEMEAGSELASPAAADAAADEEEACEGGMGVRCRARHFARATPQAAPPPPLPRHSTHAAQLAHTLTLMDDTARRAPPHRPGGSTVAFRTRAADATR